ncbi:MAG: OmpA family protein [Pseudomonadota bacterium]
MKLLPKFLLTAMAATVLIPALAATQDAVNQGYVVDSSGQIVTNSTGLCWHDSDWTPARAVEQCDPTIRPLALAEPVPKSVVVAPPVVVPAPLPQKMSFSGDALFAFDKAVLKPEGQVMLADLAKQLKTANYETIVVSGHADRLGSAKYNQKLSESRATSVKDFLVSKDIPASRISASGKGETEPVTKVDECKGAKSAKVIACLQPNRRVDVEVSGTQAVAMTR